MGNKKQKIKYLLGIDIGGSGVKAGIFRSDGTLLGISRLASHIISSNPGWAEFSCNHIWQNFPSLISGCSKNAGIEPSEINALGFSTTCPAVLAINNGGNPLTNAIMNFDQRSLAQVEKIKKHINDDEFFQITGNRLLPGAIALSSILWIKEKEPKIYNETFCFGTITTFLINKLTGKLVLDWCQASFTGLFNTSGDKKWNEKLIQVSGVKKETLPRLLPPDSPAGTVNKDAAAFTGLAEGTIVASGSADTVCSALGIGFLDTKKLFISSGTSEIVSGIMDRSVFEKRFLNRHYINNLWIFHAAISTAGAALKWLKTIIDSKNNIPDGDFIEFLKTSAGKSNIGAGQLFFLPYLQGERSPIWDPLAKGVFFGLTLNSSVNEITRAVFESIGFALKQNIQIAEKLLDTEIKKIFFTGGGAQNTFWIQLKSSITGKTFLVNKFGETAMLGAAMLAGICADIYKDCYEATDIAARKDYIEINPDKNEYKKYERLSMFYEELYCNLKVSFQKLSEINRDAIDIP